MFLHYSVLLRLLCGIPLEKNYLCERMAINKFFYLLCISSPNGPLSVHISFLVCNVFSVGQMVGGSWSVCGDGQSGPGHPVCFERPLKTLPWCFQRG